MGTSNVVVKGTFGASVVVVDCVVVDDVVVVVVGGVFVVGKVIFSDPFWHLSLQKSLAQQ